MRILLVIRVLVMVLIASLTASSSVVQNPDDKNWRYLVTSDDGNDIFYIPEISYGNIREILWFERNRDPNKEININLENTTVNPAHLVCLK